mmetsp:Transcript_38165/g.107849  ORF Transcript_38165/g.107849 Transcript_38165/m.107849 type:complete len:262 (+) Transcript_38165:268-1053(+)
MGRQLPKKQSPAVDKEAMEGAMSTSERRHAGPGVSDKYHRHLPTAGRAHWVLRAARPARRASRGSLHAEGEAGSSSRPQGGGGGGGLRRLHHHFHPASHCRPGRPFMTPRADWWRLPLQTCGVAFHTGCLWRSICRVAMTPDDDGGQPGQDAPLPRKLLAGADWERCIIHLGGSRDRRWHGLESTQLRLCTSRAVQVLMRGAEELQLLLRHGGGVRDALQLHHGHTDVGRLQGRAWVDDDGPDGASRLDQGRRVGAGGGGL